jgi:membrane protein YdbS with pleckstrin-like domain
MNSLSTSRCRPCSYETRSSNCLNLSQKVLYARGMKRSNWHEGELHIVSVTPVPFGLTGPVLSFAALTVLLVAGYESVRFVRHQWPIFALVILGPTALVILTRTWRWRSNRITVTSHRIEITHGTIRRQSDSVYFDHLVGVHTQRRVRDRLARRGRVTIETSEGPRHLGTFRHPDSLVRVIQHQRDAAARDAVPLDTTFDFERPAPYTPRLVRRRSHRRAEDE